MILLKVFKFFSRIIQWKYNQTKFGAIGKGSRIGMSPLIKNKKCIKLGTNVILFPNSRIELIKQYSGKYYNPELIIGNNSQIHQNCHITCAQQIVIGNNVTIVANVTITDIIHPHEDVSKPINQNQIKTLPVRIDDEVYIYNNSVILPGVSIGKHSIIGANSVVTTSVPSYSIAVGNPAKVKKSYNFETKLWERVKSD